MIAWFPKIKQLLLTLPCFLIQAGRSFGLNRRSASFARVSLSSSRKFATRKPRNLPGFFRDAIGFAGDSAIDRPLLRIDRNSRNAIEFGAK